MTTRMNTKQSHYVKVLIVHLLIHLCLSSNDEYHCWKDPTERHTLKFINNWNKNMTHLPSVRLIQGYYPSQFAMQYAAYVYLKEKMGVNVTFYPDNDPNALFDRYSGYLDWCNTSNTSNTSNSSTCSQYAPYPRFYFEDIKNDDYDLLVEIWDVMVRTGNGNEYFKDDTVLNGGMNGVYGEGGWFVPKYIYDNNPEWTLPKSLKYNETLRQIFIDAYTKYSDENYIDKWWEIWNNKLDEYRRYGYELPNNSKPIIFGSYHGYAISHHSGKLIHNLLNDGINWTFAAFGDEPKLTEFVIDLYSKQLPFIANLYSPHLDFATILPNTTGYMQFERIGLPRNPNNDVDDVCYINGECSFPLSPLIKIANPRIQTRFPEMFPFLLDFKMTTNDVNDIIAYHQEAKTYNLTNGHQEWINATCKWLKQSKNTTDEWYQDIVRYDCIFGEESNCGFNYYYLTKQDAMNDENKTIIPLYDSVGGFCMNDTNEPLCYCQSPYLIGNTCRDSCPGLIGPIYDPQHVETNNNSNTVLKMGNFTFYHCHGHGICNIDHKSCECELGFVGNDCHIMYETFEYATHYMMLWLILFIICIIILILSILWIYKNKHYKTIKALSPNLTILFTFGPILLCIGSIIYLFHPLNDLLCNLRNYCYGVGAIITVMAPLCKTYRVVIIFGKAKNLKKVAFPDKKLLIHVLTAVIIETIICTIYVILHQVNGGVDKLYLDQFHRIEYVCNQSDAVQYIHAANYLYIFTLIMILSFLSYKNRTTHKVFKESRCAYFGSFFSLFAFLVVVIFNVTVDDIHIIITIQSGAMIIAMSVIWCLFYGIRIYKFFKYPDNRSTVNLTIRSSTQRVQLTDTTNSNEFCTPKPIKSTSTKPSSTNSQQSREHPKGIEISSKSNQTISGFIGPGGYTGDTIHEHEYDNNDDNDDNADESDQFIANNQ